jgi:hypothetical protein
VDPSDGDLHDIGKALRYIDLAESIVAPGHHGAVGAEGNAEGLPERHLDHVRREALRRQGLPGVVLAPPDEGAIGSEGEDVGTTRLCAHYAPHRMEWRELAVAVISPADHLLSVDGGGSPEEQHEE